MFPIQQNAQWKQTTAMIGKKYECGFCDAVTASNHGYFCSDSHFQPSTDPCMYICNHCKYPTLFLPDGTRFPARSNVASLKFLPPDTGNIFEEIRRAVGINAPTLVTMGCRKILMHIAVDKGAAENLKFIQYVDYLISNNYVPAGSDEWVKAIKDLGNEANHEIAIIDFDKADRAVKFTEMLLRICYEFPALAKQQATS